ncbi:M14 family metallopeptidase [Parendozoicomonas haliclonae]|uniref:Zinc carboxypeptidase n=1 Tax=Parendozoicomonas haliclonae TaxID=1960125 RepID=A0A1X7AQU9_9GAMM|nr:M14 family metallocarboxypeptidase [Parendozoicomonas haliclonae]SMA50691.1 Zinc carboxypeptidase [Parendozoicomonas haliclonae]
MTYPIGTPGTPWGETEKQQWLAQQSIKRSYMEEVLDKLAALPEYWHMDKYGALSIDPMRYPLFVIRNSSFDANKPTVLITGGVHGYETSGVQGAIGFAMQAAQPYLEHFNFVIAPCLSPWGYETINRWNSATFDPNRSFTANNRGDTVTVEESGLLTTWLDQSGLTFLAHFDLHETTDTDNSEFRPALAARDAIEQKSWNIPDGFYGVGDSSKPEPGFQKAIIDAVSQVTHIADADDNNRLIGEPLAQYGVINIPKGSLGLCASVTDAPYVTTTEVYPDSPRATDAICIAAQIAAIQGGLDYLIKNRT